MKMTREQSEVTFRLCFPFLLISLSYHRNNLDYLYDPSLEHLHTKYYLQITWNPWDISVYFICSSVLINRCAISQTFFSYFRICATTVKFIVKLQTGHTQWIFVYKSALSPRKCRGQNNFPKISLPLDVSFYLMFLITYFTYQFYQKNAQNMHYNL